MNKKINSIVAITIIFSLIVVGCAAPNNDNNVVDNDTDVTNGDVGSLKKENNKLKDENEQLKSEIESIKNQNKELQEKISSTGPNPNSSLLQTSLEVMELVKNNNMLDLSNYVHPTKGLRFTPYFHIDTQNDQVFTPQQVASLNQDTTVYNWGAFDGSGDPIDFKFNDYYDRFVYDEDYIVPHIIGNNTAIGVGNITDNIAIEYPNGEFVEFHFTGFDSQYDGMDWRSLRLVFEQNAGAWYLVGIVHGEWTI